MTLTDAWDKAVAGAATAIGGAVIWIVRRVLTNQRQIELLMHQNDTLNREFKARDRQRVEDREAMKEVKADVKELRQDIRNLFQRKD